MSTTISLKVDFNESFNKKVDQTIWTKIISESLDLLTLEAEKQCKIECPVRTGNLKRGHTTNMPFGLEKYVMNNVEYAPYVVYGTKNQNPNDYPGRVKIKLFHSNALEQALHIKEKKYGLID